MSNSWVIHGSRTASGRPILANDPHLAIEMPSVWWEVHVVSDTLNVAGVTIPGIPFVVIGHNERIGWGLTNVGSDVQDFFVETLDPSRQRYRVGDEWVPLQIRRHEIRVSGRDEPVIFEVRSTRHGPVRNPFEWYDVYPGDAALPAQLGETVLALKWQPVLEEDAAGAFDRLGRAASWPEFVDAVRRFAAPAQNFVYADVDGNIGYAMSGLLPVRAGSDGTRAGVGRAARCRLARMDRHRSASGGAESALGSDRDGEQRSRSRPAITSSPVIGWRRFVRSASPPCSETGAVSTSARCAQIQADVTSLSADLILKAIRAARFCRRSFARGIGESTIGPMSLVYEAFEEALWRRTFADEMSPPLYDRFYRYAGNGAASRVCMPSSAIRGRRGSTIDRRRM